MSSENSLPVRSTGVLPRPIAVLSAAALALVLPGIPAQAASAQDELSRIAQASSALDIDGFSARFASPEGLLEQSGYDGSGQYWVTRQKEPAVFIDWNASVAAWSGGFWVDKERFNLWVRDEALAHAGFTRASWLPVGIERYDDVTAAISELSSSAYAAQVAAVSTKVLASSSGGTQRFRARTDPGTWKIVVRAGRVQSISAPLGGVLRYDSYEPASAPFDTPVVSDSDLVEQGETFYGHWVAMSSQTRGLVPRGKFSSEEAATEEIRARLSTLWGYDISDIRRGILVVRPAGEFTSEFPNLEVRVVAVKRKGSWVAKWSSSTSYPQP